MFKELYQKIEQWEAIYQAQAKFLGSVEASRRMKNSPILHLRDMRTIHMGSGRQSGRTSWILDQVINNGNQMLIVKDKAHKTTMPEQPIVRDQVGMSKVMLSTYTWQDVQTMFRTQEEKIKQILSETERVFFMDADFLPMKDVLNLMAGYLPEEVVIVAVH